MNSLEYDLRSSASAVQYLVVLCTCQFMASSPRVFRPLASGDNASYFFPIPALVDFCDDLSIQRIGCHSSSCAINRHLRSVCLEH